MGNRFTTTISLVLISSALVFSGCQQKKEDEEQGNAVGGGAGVRGHVTNHTGVGTNSSLNSSTRGGFGSSGYSSGMAGG